MGQVVRWGEGRVGEPEADAASWLAQHGAPRMLGSNLSLACPHRSALPAHLHAALLRGPLAALLARSLWRIARWQQQRAQRLNLRLEAQAQHLVGLIQNNVPHVPCSGEEGGGLGGQWGWHAMQSGNMQDW